jgi:hypothetical protein
MQCFKNFHFIIIPFDLFTKLEQPVIFIINNSTKHFCMGEGGPGGGEEKMPQE